jgi:cytoskeletal protein CcmA (bactofilin family)
MFAQRPPIEPTTAKTTPGDSGAMRMPTPASARSASPPVKERSVIGSDLKIVGQGLQIISQGILQVDGEVVGDVQGAEVVVGPSGKVSGKVAGHKVDVFGRVTGLVCGNEVVLKASSIVDGDIHHRSLAIETGAQFSGGSRRAALDADLTTL